MAAKQEKEVVHVREFNAKCGQGIEFSQERRVASGKGLHGLDNFAFSNDQIPIGLQFSVKILDKGSAYVSPISASSRPPTSDAPYTVGGAVHVVHCCLFFVYRDGVDST